MQHRFLDQVVVIVGATGGLGTAFAHAFAQEGARLVLVGRNTEKMMRLAEELEGRAAVFSMDIVDPEGPAALKDFIVETYGRVDVIVNTAGVDVRKPLGTHTLEDIESTLDVNLRGAILLTQAFLPMLRQQNQGTIMHIGGFADGRLAFPYYSVDGASRAGLRTFIEAVNRELAVEGSQALVSYFSPSPAQTEAERPFFPLWQQMGIKIEPAERVASELLTAIQRREAVHIMGGLFTSSFAQLNSVAPNLANPLQMNRYARILEQFFNNQHSLPPTPPARQQSWVSRLGISLVVLSFVLYGGLPALPFIPISTPAKLMLSTFLIGFGEATFWIGGLLLGKEVIARYRKWLNPCNWFASR